MSRRAGGRGRGGGDGCDRSGVIARPAGMSDSEDSDDSDFEMSWSSKRVKPPIDPLHRNGHAWVEPPKPVVPPIELFKMTIINGDEKTALEIFQTNRQNISVNKYLEDGWTLLLTAANYGVPFFVDFLLKEGADPGLSTVDGYTCLMAVTDRQNDVPEANVVETAKLLIGAHANVNAVTVYGKTALMYAAQESRLDLLHYFLDCGASIDVQDTDGSTALIVAAGVGFGKGVRLLIERKANVHIFNNQNLSAYETAMAANFVDLACMLYKIETSKWRPGLHPSLMEESMDTRPKFQDERKAQSRMVEISQIDMTLENIGLTEYQTKFAGHEIQYLDFIRMTEDDLIEMGVEDGEVRGKILEAAQAIFARDWSGAKVLPLHLQSEIETSESVCMLMDLNKHTKRINDSVAKTSLRISQDDKMLEQGVEQYPISEVISGVDGVTEAMAGFEKRIQELMESLLILRVHASGEKQIVGEDENDGASAMLPVQNLKSPTSISKAKWIIIGAVGLTLSGALIVLQIKTHCLSPIISQFNYHKNR